MKLYEYFNCKNEDELIDKLVRKDKSVKKLLDFYENSNKAKEKIILDHPKKVASYLIESEEDYLKKNNFRLIGTNVHLEIVADISFPVDITLKEFCTTLAQFNILRYFTICRKENSVSLNNILGNINNSVLEKIDSFIYSNSNGNYKIVSSIVNTKECKLDAKDKIKKEYHTNKKKETVGKIDSFLKTVEYSSISDKYYLNKILDKNYFNNKENILNDLKDMYKKKTRENFVVVGIDDSGYIREMESIFIGSSIACMVDGNSLFNYFGTKPYNQFIVFHNHPSGSLVPSIQDKNTKDTLEGLISLFGKRIIDNLIVSDEGVYDVKNDRQIILGADQLSLFDDEWQKDIENYDLEDGISM